MPKWPPIEDLLASFNITFGTQSGVLLTILQMKGHLGSPLSHKHTISDIIAYRNLI